MLKLFKANNMKLLYIVLLFIIYSCSNKAFLIGSKHQLVPANRRVHRYEYSLCRFKGQRYFKHGCDNCDMDCWKLDSLHFFNPKRSYDEIDSVLTYKN